MSLDLSVIVVSWMSREHLGGCLDSIARSAGGLRVETWLVDNASTDGSADFVAEHHPAAKLIRNRENVGFGRAVNQALARSTGRHVLLLNPDSELVGDALEAMVAFMDANPRAGIATCRVENPDGTLQRGCRRLLPTPRRLLWRSVGLTLLFPRSAFFADYNLTSIPEDRTHAVEAVSGSFLMIRGETVAAIGPMDEAFFMYGEDLDWCARAGAAGWQVLYHPGARVIHAQGASSARNRVRTIRALHDAGEIYYRKHLAATRPWIVNALVLASLRVRRALLVAKAALASGPARRAPSPPASGGARRIDNQGEGAALVRNLR